MGQNKQVRKQGQRKSAVGVLLRVSCKPADVPTFCSNDTTSFTVGSAPHHAGITLYLTDELWPELHACLKTSKWRSRPKRTIEMPTLHAMIASEPTTAEERGVGDSEERGVRRGA